MEDIVSGYAKRGFDKYICDEKSLFYKIIKKEIIPVLPKRYEFSQIYFYLEKYYPGVRTKSWTVMPEKR